MKRRRFHRVRHHAANAGRGGKGTAVAALVGAVTAFAIGKTAEHVEFVRKNWWAPPVLLMGVGHFVKRKHLNAGTAVIGAAGAIGYYGYALSGAGGSIGAQGDADAMPVDPGDAGEMSQGNAGAFDDYAQLNANTVGAMGLTEASDNYEAVEAYGLQG